MSTDTLQQVPLATRPRVWEAAGALAALLALIAAAVVWAWPQPPGEDSVEVGFARDMATHHMQAVEMAELIRDRTDDPDIAFLARDIAQVQQGQIGQFFGWLDVWGRTPTGAQPAMAWMGMPTDGLMPGMATREELQRLADLRGPEADELFLELMIDHHQGGVHMAEAAVQREVGPPARRLAEVIAASQQSEIETMQAMLAELTGTPAPVDQPSEQETGTGHEGHG